MFGLTEAYQTRRTEIDNFQFLRTLTGIRRIGSITVDAPRIENECRCRDLSAEGTIGNMLNHPPDRSRAMAAGCLWIAVLMSGCSDEPTSPDSTPPPAIGNLSVFGVAAGR